MKGADERTVELALNAGEVARLREFDLAARETRQWR